MALVGTLSSHGRKGPEPHEPPHVSVKMVRGTYSLLRVRWVLWLRGYQVVAEVIKVAALQACLFPGRPWLLMTYFWL